MRLIREKCCCFTGHRLLPAREGLWLRRRIREEIWRRADQGVATFLAGGALGFDTIAAQEVVRLRDTVLPDIELVLVLPGQGQEDRWRQRDKEVYWQLLAAAGDTVYTGHRCVPEAYLRRDRYMVDNSAQCICYFNRDSQHSGTAYTVNYAKRQGLALTNLAYRPEPRFQV